MEIPMIAASPYFGTFLQPLKRFLTAPQYRNLLHYLLGLLLCEGRRTLAHLSRSRFLARSYNRLHHFLSTSPWDEEALNEERIQQMMRHVQIPLHPQDPPVGFLIGDDTTNPKRGRKMAGWGLHHSTTEDALIPSQCIVSTLYHVQGLDIPLYASLYKTQASCLQQHEVFETKNDLLVQHIQRASLPEGLRTIGLFDAWYFNRIILRACQAKGIEAIGRLASNRRALLCSRDSIGTRLSDWFHTLRTTPRHPFRSIGVRNAQGQTHQLWMFHWTGFIAHLGLVQLVMLSSKIRGRDAEPIFIASTDLNLNAEQVVAFYFKRWAIETFFWTVKERLGFNHYQVRPERSAKRHWLLCFLAYSYLVSSRRLWTQKTDSTLGDCQRLEQQENFKHLVGQIYLRVKERGLSLNTICHQLTG